LHEVNFGHFEGIPWAQIPKSAVDAWTADFGNHRFGGVESANEVLQRVKAAFDDSLALRRNNVLWITHAGVIRAASLVMQGIYQVSSTQQWPQAVVEFGSCVTIDNHSI
jgi:alpha-ribazole phosphatase